MIVALTYFASTLAARSVFRSDIVDGRASLQCFQSNTTLWTAFPDESILSEDEYRFLCVHLTRHVLGFLMVSLLLSIFICVAFCISCCDGKKKPAGESINQEESIDASEEGDGSPVRGFRILNNGRLVEDYA